MIFHQLFDLLRILEFCKSFFNWNPKLTIADEGRRR